MKEFVEKLIDRLEEEITALKNKCPTNVDFDKGIYKAEKIINELAEEYSAITPQNLEDGWIPCSERLPKYDILSEYYEEVIVTLDDGRVTAGCYRNLDKEWWVNAESGTKHAINATDHVTSWQPLPQPYKKGSADNA